MEEFDPKVVEALRKPFAASEVKQRPGGGGKQLDYVPIETVLGRLLEVAPGYSWRAAAELRMTVDGGRHVAFVTGDLIIDGKRATGFGAMVNPDPDMAIKSANSEAMKNAAKNGFGIALELWDEEHRASLATDRAAASGDVRTLKGLLTEKYAEQTGNMPTSAQEVADHFNVSPADLSKVAVLKELLGL